MVEKLMKLLRERLGYRGELGGFARPRTVVHCAVLLATLVALPHTAFAAETEITFRGQKIYAEGAEIKWIGDSSSKSAELLLFFRNPAAAAGSLRSEQNFTARVLAVGGGGAGGTVRSSSYTGHPGGGGGGAGELVDRENVAFVGGTQYLMTVGAGGAATGVSGTASKGANGADTSIATTAGDILRVLGGGGGGGETVGADGGSGGGGSNDGAAGGAGKTNEKDGRANDGGVSGRRYAAGGGGAGAVGGNGSTGTSGGSGGNGGDGVESDIDPDNVRYYAAGGGGGNTAAGTVGAGGQGGGGNGGSNANTDAAAPTAGLENTGSGGGGGGRYKPGAAGGSGIIIIRITWIEQPISWKQISVTSVDGRTGYIYVDNDATYTKIGGDVVITYSEEHGALSLIAPEGKAFTTPVWAQARVLAVGGGGGGGLVRTLNATTGGGAGGGAGGMVEQEGIHLTTNGVYQVTVGRGGLGATENNTAGESGTSSALQQNGFDVVPVALGGGGGGAAGAGASGGSGGGGSMAAGVASVGGAGTTGQGFAGGSGGATYRGAGGGGAGGAGEDAVAGSSTGGLGGLAKKSDITGADIWYAGGGGGAYLNQNNTTSTKSLGGLGGGTSVATEKGGGGNGAGCDGGSSGTGLNPIVAGNGTDGLGGGGGGGVGVSGVSGKGGNGGNGVVIIRLSGFVVGSVTLPPAPPNLVYNGEEQSAITAGDSWAYAGQLTGTWKATNAGTYTFEASLPADSPYEFIDGGHGPKAVTWTIKPMPVDLPKVVGEVALTNAMPLVFNNREYQAVAPVDETKTNHGVDADGYCWMAATTGNKIPLAYCWLEKSAGDDNRGYINKNAGTNTIVVTLNNPLPVTNFVWRTSSSADPSSLYWHVAQADNEITSFTIADVQEILKTVSTSCSWTWQGIASSEDKVVYTYYKGETQPGNDSFYTITETPTEPGIYWAHAYICKDSKHEPGNWKDAHAYTRFCIWRHPSKMLTDFVNISISDSSSSTLPNFPVLVKISEPVRDKSGLITNGIPGFTYARAGLTGQEIRFIQRSDYKTTNAAASDELLPYEIETWNPNGESRVWVKVNPSSYTGSKNGKFRMYWHRDPSAELFVDKPSTEVWSAYTGVWHLNEDIPAGAAATTTSQDATGNGLNLVPKMGGNKNNEKIDGNFKEMYSVPGVLGNGRQIAETPQQNGNYLEVPQYELGSTFVFETWVKVDKFEKVNNNCFPQIVCRKPTSNTGDGWHVELNGNASFQNVLVRGSGGDGNVNGNLGKDWPGSGYNHLAIVFTGGNSAVIYMNGAQKASGSGLSSAPSNSNELPLAIGNGMFGAAAGSFHYPALEGAFDEIRLYALPSSYANWVTASYKMVANANFCTFGAVNKPDDDKPDERVWVNYWSQEPSLKRYWNLGELTASKIMATSAKGALKFGGTVAGGTVTYLGRAMPSGALWEAEGKTVPSSVKGPNTVEYYMSTMNLTSGDYPGRHILFDGTRIFDVEIVESCPSPVDPAGGTASGRILLANDDMTPDQAGNTVTNQSYFETGWYHRNADHTPPEQFNLLPGYNHELTNATTRLWKLHEVYIGNILSTNHTLASSSSILPANYLTLPYGSNSKNTSSPEAYTNDFVWYEAAHLVMRNVENAKIVSSCYTNGIGAIYFDVVNAYGGTDIRATDNKLVVEYAENVDDEDDEGTEWRAIPFTVMDMKNMTITTNTTASGKSELDCLGKLRTEATSSPYLGKYFFRVIAKLDHREPCRFRIRRSTVRLSDETLESQPDDPKGFILIDNVIASFPPPIPEIKEVGFYDETREGSAVLGMEGAFSARYPVAGESFYGYGRLIGDTNNVTSARLRYRWRYLDAESEPQIYEGRENWNIAFFNVTNNTFATLEPLAYNGRHGDIEYYLDLTGFAEFYEYTDYTGIGYTEANLKKMPTEEPDKYIEARSKHGIYPSHGKDWFVRLREFKNPRRGFTLYTRESDEEKAEIVTNRLELVDDTMWRACIRTARVLPKLEFRLESDAPASDRIGETATVTNFWRAATKEDSTRTDATTLPYAFAASEAVGATWSSVPCDAKTGFLLFQMDEAKGELSVYRADKQDFNSWSSGVNTNGLFVGSSVDTNVVSHTTTESAIDLNEWSPTVVTNVNWREDFKVGEGEVAPVRYPREEPFSSGLSQKHWTAQNAMWTYGKWAHVSEAEVGGAKVYGQGDDSAVQLAGRGYGSLSYIGNTDIPDGLDTVTYTARVAQYNEFSDFAYFDGVVDARIVPGGFEIDYARDMTNGTLVTMAALTELGAGAYDGDGSVSLAAFYHPSLGCYEFRVSRGGKDTNAKLSLYRWSNAGGGMSCELLGYREFDDLAAKLVRPDTSKLAGLFISVEPYVNGSNSGTLVNAGIMRGDTVWTASPTALDNQQYATIVYFDTSAKRLTQGTFGVLSRNCPAVVVKPITYPLGVGFLGGTVNPNEINQYRDQKITYRGTPLIGAANETWYKNWIERPGRIMRLEGHGAGTSAASWGFQAETNISQKVIIQLSDYGMNEWVDAVTNTVSGFCDQSFELPVKSEKKCEVRLQVMGKPDDTRRDVVINEVQMTQWNAQSTPNYDNRSYNYLTNKFVYTAGWVLPASSEGRALRLQPTRTPSTDTPVSLRSPLMRGLGLFHFQWRNGDPRCKLHVQMCEEATINNIVDLTDTLQSDSRWTTVETIDLGLAGATGSKTIYFNRRYNGKLNGRDYYYGLVRVVVDHDVEVAARSGDTARKDPLYGSVEIADAFVLDLPEYDKQSWSGWNFRTAGWDGKNPDSFANLYDGFRGLSGLLNNTLEPVSLAQRPAEYYSGNVPNIQSPTFGTNSVGAISFRARLYSASDIAAGHGAVVTIYGAKALDEHGEPIGWMEAGDIVVTNTTYELKSMKLRGSDNYKAIRLGVKGVKGVTDGGTAPEGFEPPLRVAIDDVVIWEKLPLTLSFRLDRARPFRSAADIKAATVVTDIDSIDEQPLLGEGFGFQGEVLVTDDEEILVNDPEYPITVDLWYYPSAEPWGFENWTNRAEAVHVQLDRASNAGDQLIFRSMLENAASICAPQFAENGETHRIVQYALVAWFYDKSHEHMSHVLGRAPGETAVDWEPPLWNDGFADPNRAHPETFSPYTVLETIAPKRAWINEVNYCETGIESSKKNQWVEIAVPSGVDMTGWKLRAYKYNGDFLSTLITFGSQTAAKSKTYTGTNPNALASHYAFYVVKSPDINNKVTADAVWPGFGAGSKGVLDYSSPYAFELTRPSGIVEHRVVTQGWNSYAEAGYDFASDYDGTNVVHELNLARTDRTEWIWSDEDTHNENNKSVSVTNAQGMVHEDWVSPLKETPGDINVGQVIPPDWFTHPNSGYKWIYSTTYGNHLRQVIGGVTNQVASLTILEGTNTNILYLVDRWYRIGRLDITGDEGRTNLVKKTWTNAIGAVEHVYDLSLINVSNRIDIAAYEDACDEINRLITNPDNQVYKPAILNWLENGVTGMGGEFVGDELKVGHYRGIDGTSDVVLDLVDMYWLDLDPTDGNWELWGGMGVKPGWSGLSGSGGDTVWPVVRMNYRDGVVVNVQTNRQTTFWLMITNAASECISREVPVEDGKSPNAGMAYAPYRIQGLGNERSDEFGGVWTSVNFKVTLALLNGKADDFFYPVRYFVFDHGSFGGEMEDVLSPFGAVVEITDPFSPSSPASEWGWQKYADMPVLPSWAIDRKITPGGVTTLKSKDTFDGMFPEPEVRPTDPPTE